MFSKKQSRFITTIIETLPCLSEEQMQFFIKDKERVKRALSVFPMIYWQEKWDKYYLERWNISLHWGLIISPSYPDMYPNLIVIDNNISLEEILSKLTEDRTYTQSTSFLDFIYTKRRCRNSYAIWTKETGEDIKTADLESNSKKLVDQSTNLLEMLIWYDFLNFNGYTSGNVEHHAFNKEVICWGSKKSPNGKAAIVDNTHPYPVLILSSTGKIEIYLKFTFPESETVHTQRMFPSKSVYEY